VKLIQHEVVVHQFLIRIYLIAEMLYPIANPDLFLGYVAFLLIVDFPIGKRIVDSYR
jgi:hypothetical protein